jgi:cytoskeletal protein CcmA (bactofilin family)
VGRDDVAERPDLCGLIGEGTSLEGEIVFEGGYRVDGRLAGRLYSRSVVIVGPTGELSVEEMRVGSLLVSGAVRGSLFVEDRLEIESGGRVEGAVTLRGPSLVMAKGAVFDGTVTIAPQEPASRGGDS